MASNMKNLRKFSPQGSGGGGFKLAGFPKEFERNFWDLFDKRYYLILIVTWLVAYSFVLLMANRNWEFSEEQIEKMKKTVIERVYGAEILPTVEELPEEETLSTTVTPTEEPAETISEAGKKIVEESATERVERRKSARATREERVRKMEQEVATAGILAIATAAGAGGTGGVEYGDVLKDLAGGAGGVTNVGEIVSGTVGIAAAETGAERTRVARGGGYGGGGEGTSIDDLIKGQGVSRGGGFVRRGEITLSGDLEVTGQAAGAGARDQNGLLAVINRNQGTVEYCYQKRLKINPSLKGEIYLEIEISPEGRVTYVKTLSSTLGDKELQACIEKNIKRWRGFAKIDPSLGSVKTRFKYIF